MGFEDVKLILRALFGRPVDFSREAVRRSLIDMVHKTDQVQDCPCCNAAMASLLIDPDTLLCSVCGGYVDIRGAARPYVVGDVGGVAYIDCTTCAKRSYHPSDIENRYCAYCKVFHDDSCQT